MIVLNLKAHEGNPRNSEGSFVSLNDGRIMYVYTKFNGDTWHDEDKADIVARYSNDGGMSWNDKDRIIKKNTCSQNIMSVSLLRLQSGKIALVFLKKESNFDCRPVICYSEDEGENWSEDIYCTDNISYMIVNNDRLIQLKNGKLLLPVASHTVDDNGELIARSDIIFYSSDDEGLTWHKTRGNMHYPPNKPDDVMQEPGVIELKDGTLWAWARTQMGSQYVSYSHDNGDSWTIAAPSDFYAPLSPMSVKRNSETEELIAVWNDINPRWNLPEANKISMKRTPLVMAKSYDEGRNWREFTILESDPTHGYCYTAIHFVSKGILLAYCCGGGKTSRVLQDSCIRLIKE